MNAEPQPAPSALYRSNYGKGTWLARVIQIRAGQVEIEHWDERHKRPYRLRATLSETYWRSAANGWRPAAKSDGTR